MASTYGNDLRLEEIGDGEQSGTWGATTNTNLELIAEALSFGTEAITTNADTHTTTIADGATDPGRSLYLKYTGTLDSTCTITIAPNSISKTWYIENGTSGSQSIIISQGSGANVTIPTGQTKVVYSDGAGSGAAMAEIGTLGVTNLNVSGDITVGDDLTVTDDMTVGGTLGVTGVLTGTSLDISGDIDVDGTSNLDVVDIDGALTQDGGAVFNEASADVDFRVESDGNTHSLFVEGSSGNVLVGTTDTTLYNNTTGTGTKLGGDGRLDVARSADTVATFNRTGSSNGEILRIISSGTTLGGIESISGDIALTSAANPIRFSINSSEKIRFGAAGQLGIGGANYGTSGQILTSGGASAAPTWAAVDGGPSYTRSTTPPGSPTAGDWWLNTNSSQQSPFIYDGTLGWIQGDGTALGFAAYLPGNSFSIRVASNGLMDIIRFETPTPQIITGAISYDYASAATSSVSNTVRGVVRAKSSTTDSYQFVVFANIGAATTFGNSLVANFQRSGGISHATRGIFCGGTDAASSISNQMEYITIATEGNGTDFGNLSVSRDMLNNACCASTTRGIIMGGRDSGGGYSNVIDYVTIANTGNATDFGNLTESKGYVSTANSTTRGIRMGGQTDTNVMDYITMASAGNATDFGDLTASSNSNYMNVVHNATYAWMHQYSTIQIGKQKITMASAGNATSITDGSGPFGTEALSTIEAPQNHSMMPGWIAATG